jgi:hypothetical protein
MSINDEELLAQHHFPLVLIAAAHSAELVVLGTWGRRKYPHTVTYGPNAFYCVPKGAGWPSHQGFSKKTCFTFQTTSYKLCRVPLKFARLCFDNLQGQQGVVALGQDRCL